MRSGCEEGNLMKSATGHIFLMRKEGGGSPGSPLLIRTPEDRKSSSGIV
jgi:hypothetical protein